jgi:hypothetical protein
LAQSDTQGRLQTGPGWTGPATTRARIPAREQGPDPSPRRWAGQAAPGWRGRPAAVLCAGLKRNLQPGAPGAGPACASCERAGGRNRTGSHRLGAPRAGGAEDCGSRRRRRTGPATRDSSPPQQRQRKCGPGAVPNGRADRFEWVLLGCPLREHDGWRSCAAGRPPSRSPVLLVFRGSRIARVRCDVHLRLDSLSSMDEWRQRPFIHD